MSTDIYIPLDIVLTHPGQFQLVTALNGDIETARECLNEEIEQDIDWVQLENELKPVLLCKFGARETWRCVEVFDRDLYVNCGSNFAIWLMGWLDDNGHKYTTPEF